MTQTVLIVDDAPFDQKILTTAVEKFGFKALCAAGSEQAILILKKQYASIDLMLLDISLPFVDGISVLGHCRTNYPAIPVIVISDSDAYEDIAEVEKWRVERFISKPVHMEDLEFIVSDVLKNDRRAVNQ